jgi:hypothetical protein
MTHIAKLKLLPRTTMKAKGATRLVGQVTGGEGIDVTKTAGNFEVSLDLDGFNVVQGPVAGTDNAVARWDGPDGRQLQDSLVSIADDGEMTVPALAGVTEIDATTRATLFEPYIYQIQAIDDDGASDQSAAIQAQIDYCEANGICEAVFPPYKIRCWPIVSHPIKLRGTGVRIAMGVLAEGQPSDVGTRLYRTAADTAQYGIDILSGANGVTIEGICFLEEHAADGPGWTPTVYKAAIRNKAPWTTIRKNVFWGTYDGVQLGDGDDFNEPGSGYVTIEDNAFACFRAGVHAYKCGDWNIAIGNWFQGYFVEDNTYQREYIRANAAPYYLGRTDSFEIFGGGAYYWQYGVLTYINPDAPSAAEGISERLKVVGFDADKVHVAYYFVARVTGEAIGCAIISDNAVVDPNTLVATTGSYGAQGNANVLFSFIGCRFHNHGIQAVIAAESNCTIKLIGCLIRDAGLDGGGVAALNAVAGATIERSLCTFIGAAAIESGAGTYVTTATLTGTETLSGKTLTSPTINGGALAGTFSGSPTFSGAPNFSAGGTFGGTWSGTLTLGGALLAGAAVRPSSNDGAALGTTTLQWSDLFLASGAVINFDNGDVTITHSANALAVAGASSGYTFDATVKPALSDGAALGTTALMWSDLFLATGGVINWDNSAARIIYTTAGDEMDFLGAAVYYFDSHVRPFNNDGGTLGSGAVAWSDLYLASGGIIDFNNGDVTITHSANAVTVAGGTLELPAGRAMATAEAGVLRFRVTGVNFNSANTDNAVTITLPAGITRYLITRTMISNASASISTATVGVFTATGGGGQQIAANQAITVTQSAADTNNNAMQLSATNANTMAYNDTTLYVRVGTAQGSAATADVIIDIYPLT